MSRRLPATGSVYRRKDGRWVAAIVIDGKRVSRYAATEVDAYSALTALVGASLTPPRSPSLRAWAEDWLTRRAIGAIEGGQPLKATTVYSYRRWLDLLWKCAPELAATPLRGLTQAEVKAGLNGCLLANRGRRVMASTATVVYRLLTDAVTAGLIAAHPMAGLPKITWEPGTTKGYQRWTPEDALSFLAECRRGRSQLAPLMAFLLTTGLRFGEAIGLYWEDVDLPGRRIWVVRNRVWIRYNVALDERPKTGAGLREVSLPAQALEALARVPQAAVGPVFLTPKGLTPSREYSARLLDGLCRRAGVPRVTPHGLRHLHAWLTLKAGGDAHAVQRRLGHADVGITMRVYLWAMLDDAQVAKKLDTLFGE